MPERQFDRATQPRRTAPPRSPRPVAPALAAGNRAVARRLQREIDLDGKVYGAGDIKAVVELLTKAGITAVNGRLLYRWLTEERKHGPYATPQDLQAALVAMTERGRAMAVKGDELEAEAAAHIGGVIAVGPNEQDEIVKSKKTPNRHIKLDVKSDSAFGIVGGAKKDANLDKFKNICGDLKFIAAEYGMTPMVFAAGDTPTRVLEAAEAAVGAANVVVRVGTNHWVTLTAFRDLHEGKLT